MTAVMPQRPTLQEPVVLTAQQYDALPPNNRMELVDGVVTLMTPATMRHQIVVQKLRAALEADRPDELKIVWEQEVRLADLLRRNPDVMAVLASAYNLDGYSYTPSQVVLAAEVVSPHTQVTDRLHKPAEYATAGIEHYWRVETLPQVAVHTYRLADSGSYTASGVFTEGDTIAAPGLPWAKIEVTDLAP
jgi:Uma2 family endonuclease